MPASAIADIDEPLFVVALIRNIGAGSSINRMPPGTIPGDEMILAVSRRGRPDDLGLPGGKIEPGEKPHEAIIREVFEETGVKCWFIAWLMDREEDTANGGVARCFLATEWTGVPSTKEEGCHVSWRHWRDLLGEQCSFRTYNEKLFRHIGWLKE